MTTHSSILAWEIPWTEVPDGLQSMGLQKRQTRMTPTRRYLGLQAWLPGRARIFRELRSHLSAELSSHFTHLIWRVFFLATPCSRQGFVPQVGFEPMPSAVKAWGLNHWASREFPIPRKLSMPVACVRLFHGIQVCFHRNPHSPSVSPQVAAAHGTLNYLKGYGGKDSTGTNRFGNRHPGTGSAGGDLQAWRARGAREASRLCLFCVSSSSPDALLAPTPFLWAK